MRALVFCLAVFAVATVIFGQSDRGTITGTVTDPAGAVVANASIEARNTATGVQYPSASSATGNYTIPQLPPGPYELTVNVPGFKTYNRTGLTVQVAGVIRVDIPLEVGSSTESVTVTAEATLLKTESGELSHNVTASNMNALPVLGIGAGQAGAAGIRNPNAVARLIPGTYWAPNSNLRINGAPMNTQSYRIEGQEAQNTGTSGVPAQNQPSVDAIQEMAIQTSNYSAEFGQVGGGYFNLTMRSGTNQYHGSGYDYFVNEALGAGTPFTDNGMGGNQRPPQRRQDWGFTVGGPLWIPKVYDGRDKTFFFVNFEQFRERQIITTNNLRVTVPTAAYRAGDFSAALTNRTFPNPDPLNNVMREGMIYDPNTTQTVGGSQVRTQFPGNAIPANRFDPVALKVLEFIPQPQGPFAGALAQNYFAPVPSSRVTEIPSFKIDQNTGSRGKLSFFWQRTYTGSALNIPFGQIDGLPGPVTTAIGTFTYAPLYRLNYDYTLTPTVLLHLGAGFRETKFDVPSVTGEGERTNFDAETVLGLRGGLPGSKFFPTMNGLEATGGRGGLKNIGSQAGNINYTRSPTFNASLSWVTGNHTYKFGSEFRTEGYPATNNSGTEGTYSFNQQQTGQPFQNVNASGNWNVGFPFASFLLGHVNQVGISNPVFPRIGKKQFGIYAQDTWKITRKLTLDYGIRYDYSTYLQEQYGRGRLFSSEVTHPILGIKGAAIFEGDGPGRCGCTLASNYPFGVAPRLGMAYQWTEKTVIRAGFGIVYTGTAGSNNATGGYASSAATTPRSVFGSPVTTLSEGIPFTPQFRPVPWPSYNAGELPTSPTAAASNGPNLLDQNAGRPARQYQWSFGVQREISRDLVVEAAYVANRGVWWPAPGLINVNAIPLQRLGAVGLDITNQADRTLLTSFVSSTTAANRGFGGSPYPQFARNQTVAQALRPFPQFSNISNYWPPLGKTWYDSLQIKGTQRLSHGLSFTSTFTWSRNMAMGAEREVNFGTDPSGPSHDIFNRQLSKHISGFDIPFQFIVSAQYQSPRVNLGNGVVNYALSDWTFSTVLQYQAGLPLSVPGAQTAPGLAGMVFQSTVANRVPGQPLFNNNWVDNTGKVRTDELDLNCHCYDSQRTLALNPNAWANPLPGQFGTSALYYTDYRSQRRPVENMAFGRTFRFTEQVNLNIRAEFSNIFNRAFWNDPASANNAQTLPARDPVTGVYTSGFGRMPPQSTTAVNTLPRGGTIVARITF